MINVGEFLEATKGMTPEEIQEFYEEHVAFGNYGGLYRYEKTINSKVKNMGEYQCHPLFPAAYELTDEEVEIIKEALMSKLFSSKPGKAVTRELLEKFDIMLDY